MPITATCPYCRSGAVRAPDAAVGRVAVCPKCKSSFTLVPDERLPGPNLSPPPAPPSPLNQPITEARSHTAHMVVDADVKEPSPAVPDPTPAATRQTIPIPTATESAAAGYNGTVLVAITLFGFAVLATQFPYGRISGLAVAALGLILGLSMLSERRLAWAAVALNLFAAALILLAPSWLGLEPWRRAVPPGGESGPRAVSHGTGELQTADWVDAASASWIQGDIRISLASAGFAPLEIVNSSGFKQRTKGYYLQLVVRIANDGVARKLELSGWARGEGRVSLTDMAGNTIAAKQLDPGWELAAQPKLLTGLFPGRSSDVLFVFEPPRKPDSLRLTLPGSGVGLTESIRFRLSEAFLHYPKPR